MLWIESDCYQQSLCATCIDLVECDYCHRRIDVYEAIHTPPEETNNLEPLTQCRECDERRRPPQIGETGYTELMDHIERVNA